MNNYGYDSAVNPMTFRNSSIGAANADNQLPGITFDGNGNPTTYKGSTLAYDAENRLTSYASAMTAAYTGDSLRAWKENSGGKTYFLYDGTKPVCELDGSGNVTAANTFGRFDLLSWNTSAGSVF